MKKMVFIGKRTCEHDPQKGEIVIVHNETIEFGCPMVQIKGQQAPGFEDFEIYYPLSSFREVLEHGETLVRELAYKVQWMDSERFPKLQKNELKKEFYLRQMRNENFS